MNKRIFLLSGLCLSTALASFFATPSAQAGFQWNPPQAAPMAPSQNESIVQSNSPVMPETVTSGPLTPMPGDETAKTSSPENIDASSMPPPGVMPGMMKSSGVQPMSESDLMDAPRPSGQSATANDRVEGFGKNIPLAIALRQIVPPQYAFSFAPNVDQGKPVSWTGGGAWTDVLNTTLASRKLHAEMNGNVVSILDGTGPAISPSQIASVASPTMPMGGGGQIIDMTQQRHWDAKPGQSLQQTLKDWSAQANVALSWQDAGDMPISRSFSYDGTFDQAVDALLSLYSGGPKEPRGKLYPNLPSGPSVLVVGLNN